MSDSADNDKKHLLGDLESIKHLLDQEEASSDKTTKSDLSSTESLDEAIPTLEPPSSNKSSSDIPLLNEVVDQSSNTGETNIENDTKPSDEISATPLIQTANELPKSNPFIPYEAINRLKKERKNMRNFAVEVMEAAQQGIAKKDLDQFDLFQYASKENQSQAPTEGNPPKPESIISLPTEAQMNELIHQVIDDHREILEEALKDALTDFIKRSVIRPSSDD